MHSNKIRFVRSGFHSLVMAFVLAMILPTACTELKQITDQLEGYQRPLTQQEVIMGLREALVIGSDSAASRLGETNGYLHNPLIRIELPAEAKIITDQMAYLPGGKAMVDDVILRINRAAEDAAREAGPVFRQAISNMTIRDGFEILNGEKDAATQYLRSQTHQELFNLYQPKIALSLNKPIVGNMSTNDAWAQLTGSWNKIANSVAGRLANLQTVNADLDFYLTERALDGLFHELAREEEKIRTDPMNRVTELLKRVFGHSG